MFITVSYHSQLGVISFRYFNLKNCQFYRITHTYTHGQTFRYKYKNSIFEVASIPCAKLEIKKLSISCE